MQNAAQFALTLVLVLVSLGMYHLLVGDSASYSDMDEPEDEVPASWAPEELASRIAALERRSRASKELTVERVDPDRLDGLEGRVAALEAAASRSAARPVRAEPPAAPPREAPQPRKVSGPVAKAAQRLGLELSEPQVSDLEQLLKEHKEAVAEYTREANENEIPAEDRRARLDELKADLKDQVERIVPGDEGTKLGDALAGG